MGLTSGAFVWGSIATGMLLLAVLAALWPRLAGRQWWWYPVRFLVLALVVAVNLVGAGGYLNRQNLWYAGWDDLLDPSLAADDRVLGGTPDAAAAVALGATWPPSSLPEARMPQRLGPEDFHPAAGGLVASVQVPGETSGHTGRALLWVPADYFDSARSTRRYPVVLAMHGSPGTPENMLEKPHLTQKLRGAVSRGSIAEAVLVIPETTPGGIDTECVDSSQVRMETWLAMDVPAWTAAHLRVRTDRSSWATLGYSAGGYCAALLPMRHPQVFATGIVMSGYFHADFSARYRPFGPGSPEYRQVDLVALARAHPPQVALWVQASSADKQFWPNEQELLAAVRPPTSVTSVVLQHAGHRWSVWDELLPQALEWLGRTAPGFRPAT